MMNRHDRKILRVFRGKSNDAEKFIEIASLINKSKCLGSDAKEFAWYMNLLLADTLNGTFDQYIFNSSANTLRPLLQFMGDHSYYGLREALVHFGSEFPVLLSENRKERYEVLDDVEGNCAYEDHVEKISKIIRDHTSKIRAAVISQIREECISF